MYRRSITPITIAIMLAVAVVTVLAVQVAPLWPVRAPRQAVSAPVGISSCAMIDLTLFSFLPCRSHQCQQLVQFAS